jgi:hypothetical protein
VFFKEFNGEYAFMWKRMVRIASEEERQDVRSALDG